MLVHWVRIQPSATKYAVGGFKWKLRREGRVGEPWQIITRPPQSPRYSAPNLPSGCKFIKLLVRYLDYFQALAHNIH